MQAARKVDSANQKVMKEAEAAHEKNIENIRAANEAKMHEARTEWGKECEVARAHHERLAIVIREEFESENEAKRRANDVLLEKQRTKWHEAVCSLLQLPCQHDYFFNPLELHLYIGHLPVMKGRL